MSDRPNVLESNKAFCLLLPSCLVEFLVIRKSIICVCGNRVGPNNLCKNIVFALCGFGYTFNSMRTVWDTQLYSIKSKCHLFNACILPALLYGCESWHLTNTQKNRILSFENRCLCRIMGVRWFDFVRNSEIRERTRQRPVTSVVMERRWNWLGHVLRMPPESLNPACLFFRPVGFRGPDVRRVLSIGCTRRN